MENKKNKKVRKTPEFDRLIEEAVEGLRAGAVNLDKILLEYAGGDFEHFLEALADALTLEEIFRESAGRTRPAVNERIIVKLDTAVNVWLSNEIQRRT